MRKHNRIATLAVVLGLVFTSIADARRVNLQITVVTAGTPVRISANHLLVDRLFIQSKAGSTGTISIMLGVAVGTTCDKTNAAHLTAQLAPGTATTPGQSFSDPQGANGNTPSDREDLALACIDSTVNGDIAIVSFWATQ